MRCSRKLPVAAPVNTTLLPMGTVWLTGLRVMTGSVTTVRVAQFVTLLHGPVTMTQ